MPIEGKFWNILELASKAQCERSYVRRLCGSKKLECVKYGIWLIRDQSAQMLIGRKKGERWDDGEGDSDLTK